MVLRVPMCRRAIVVVGSMVIAMCWGGIGFAGQAMASGTKFFAYANGASTPGCPQETTPSDGCSLSTALGDAGAGDTVLLATDGATGSYVGNWTLGTAGTSPADPVTIEPATGVANPTLDGGGAGGPGGSILDITKGASVTITGVTFTDGDATAGGGAGNGGAIDTGDGAAGGTVTISDSTFSGNDAQDGGAIDSADAGSGTLSVSGSTFTGNSGGDGGAIDNGDSSGSGTLSVSDSTFTGNSAQDGGAIDNSDLDGSGTVSVWDSTFSGDGASRNGDEIDNDDNGVQGSVFVAADLFDGDCDQNSGTWDDEGFNVGTDVSCLNNGPADAALSSVRTLGVLQDNGGPTQTIAPWASNPAIRRVPPNTTVTLNTVSTTLCPGTDQRGVVTLLRQPCAAGSVSGGGLLAYADGGGSVAGCPPESTSSNGCSLEAALADTVPGDTVVLATPGSSAHYDGNWTLDTAGTAQRAPVTIEPAGGVAAPTLDGQGSGGPLGPMLNLTNGVSVTITGVTFTGADNTANSDGGAIDADDGTAGGIVAIDDSIFTANSASGEGGAIDMADYGGSGTLSVSHSTFSGNSAARYDGGAIDTGDDGGSGTVVVSDSTFTGNTAVDDGGAIDIGDFAGSGTASVSGSTFSGNTATGDGGAIDNGDVGGSGTASVSGSTFSGNSATIDGGAIDNGDAGGAGTASVTDSVFASNHAVGDGGVIDTADNSGIGTLTVSRSTFSSAVASRDGGAIDNGDHYGLGTVKVTGSTFKANKAAAADGGALDNGDHSGSGTLSMADSTVTGNTASTGGGIDTGDNGGLGTVSVSGTTFSGDHASSGAAIDSGDDSGGGSVFVAGDLFNGSCAQPAGTWVDKGFNAGTDGSCLQSTPLSSDTVLIKVADLGRLRSYGGPTATIPVLADNPASGLIPRSTTVTLSGGPVALCPRTDQRGVTSPAGGRCDAGAMQSAAVTLSGRAAPAKAIVRKPVILSAKITPVAGLEASLPAPTGSLFFDLGRKTMCQTTALTSRSDATKAIGSCTTKKLPKGTDRVRATYESTDGYATSTRHFTVHVHHPKKKKKKRHKTRNAHAAAAVSPDP